MSSIESHAIATRHNFALPIERSGAFGRTFHDWHTCSPHWYRLGVWRAVNCAIANAIFRVATLESMSVHIINIHNWYVKCYIL